MHLRSPDRHTRRVEGRKRLTHVTHMGREAIGPQLSTGNRTQSPDHVQEATGTGQQHRCATAGTRHQRRRRPRGHDSPPVENADHVA